MLCIYCGDLHPRVSCVSHARARGRPPRRATQLLDGARQRARLKNLDCNLTVEWIDERLRAGACEVSGLPLGKGRGMGPSLDRTDNTRGYTKDNVKIVCWLYNRAKGVDGHADVLRLAKALVAKEAA